jgi:hypothetical protein
MWQHADYPSGSACYCATWTNAVREILGSDEFNFSITFPAGAQCAVPEQPACSAIVGCAQPGVLDMALAPALSRVPHLIRLSWVAACAAENVLCCLAGTSQIEPNKQPAAETTLFWPTLTDYKCAPLTHAFCRCLA